jgi:SAM-dependent methyltransferase
MLNHLQVVGITLAGARLLEMGTGWYPTFPFCLYLGGAARVDTVDLNRYLRVDLTQMCAARLAAHTSTIADASGCREAEVAARQRALVAALGSGVSIETATDGVVAYRAPCDASATGLPSGSIDVVFSNSVLEHVPGSVIEACFAEARRLLRPRGIVFHSVNCGDHYAYVDRSIDQLHYLRYSDHVWRRWNNAFLYQNRLRAIDFTRMARAAGFAIEIDTSRASPKRLAQLDATPVHPDFTRYTREQLAITSIDFIGRIPQDEKH